MRKVTIMAMALVCSGPANAQAAPDAPTPGTVVVQIAATEPAPLPQDEVFADAVAAALSTRGFLALPSRGLSRYIANVTVTREGHGVATFHPRASGPATTMGNWTARLAVTLPSRKSDLGELDVIRLRIDLMTRDGDEEVWGATALTTQVEGSAAAAPDVVAPRLAHAVIDRFPQRLDEPLAIP